MFFFNYFHFTCVSVFIVSHSSLKLDIYCEIVMFTWWQGIWNTDLHQHNHSHHHNQHHEQKISIKNVALPRQSHIANRRRMSHTQQQQSSHQMPYSIHQNNCIRQSKCIRMFSTEQSTRMKSFCSLIILIHCFNVLVLAIASENSTNTTQPQPCDRTRRVYTDVQGEISNGPLGSNYTQVSILFVFFSFYAISSGVLFNIISFHLIQFDSLRCDRWLFVLLLLFWVWACVFLVELISYSIFLPIFSLHESRGKNRDQNWCKLNVPTANHVLFSTSIHFVLVHCLPCSQLMTKFLWSALTHMSIQPLFSALFYVIRSLIRLFHSHYLRWFQTRNELNK